MKKAKLVSDRSVSFENEERKVAVPVVQPISSQISPLNFLNPYISSKLIANINSSPAFSISDAHAGNFVMSSIFYRETSGAWIRKKFQKVVEPNSGTILMNVTLSAGNGGRVIWDGKNLPITSENEEILLVLKTFLSEILKQNQGEGEIITKRAVSMD